MPTKPREVNVLAAPIAAGMKTKKVELEAVEDEQERVQRLHKELWSFYIKDLLPFAMAIVVIAVAAAISLIIMFRSESAPAEKDWAKTVFTAIMSGAVGMLFGKQLGK